MSNLRAVTFDLWDTVFLDDTDEPKRARAGVLPKPEDRRRLVHETLSRHGIMSREMIRLAYDVTDAAFSKVWHHQSVTWTVRERLEVLLRGLGCELPEVELAELIRIHEEMELEFRPDPVPGIHDAIRALGQHYTLGVVSDTIFSPGRCLRELLRGEGLLDHFDAFAFSDEVGRSKPAPEVFEAICRELDVSPDQVVHVGDREHNDVAGPHRAGMRAVLLTAGKDRGSGASKADAICDDCRRLPEIIASL